MTSRSSYVFHPDHVSAPERKEGAVLNRVFVSENRITVYAKEFVRTSKSDVLFEKVISQQVFSLHENRHGDKYIKAFYKSLRGGIHDNSLGITMSTRRIDNRLISVALSDTCKVFVEKIILGWFGYTWDEYALTKLQDKLLFPALRDESFAFHDEFTSMLSELQASGIKVTKALRENNSWHSFLMDICSPTVRTVEDVKIIEKNPELLVPFAVMDLGSNMSSIYEMDSDALFWMCLAFSSDDMNIMYFMFRNLSSYDKQRALELLFRIGNAHHDWKTTKTSLHRFSYVTATMSLERVPGPLRPELAAQLLNRLLVIWNQLEEGELPPSDQTFFPAELSTVVRNWFAGTVLPPQLHSKITIEAAADRFRELFGLALPTDELRVRFHSIQNLTFCSIHKVYSENDESMYPKDLFASLIEIAKTTPKGRGLSDGNSILNGYINDAGTFTPVAGALLSLDDLMSIVESGVVETDKHLTKLGRAITPENRVAFLTFGSKERKFKNTWKYYDWGVTDAAKILALKVANITTKNEVQAYKDLPDEMFYEFLAMASGREIETLTGQVAAKPENLFRSYRNSMGKMTLRKTMRK